MTLFKALRFILSLAVFALAPWALAQGTCFSSVSEYNAIKSKLPATFQRLPVYLTADTWKATAAFVLNQSGNKLMVGSHVSAIVSSYNVNSDATEVRQICYDGKSFKVSLKNGKSYDGQVVGSQVVIMGLPFKKSTPAEFASIVNKAGNGATKSVVAKGAAGGQ
jgi:hypothetical protein